MSNHNRHSDSPGPDSNLEFSENPKQDRPISNMAKDPEDWVTGNQAMTGAQASYLKTLSEEAHEDFDPKLSKAEASVKIDQLQEKTGRTTSR